MMKNERGFTIMELLVVIVIIGVLAAIGVPTYRNMTERAKKATCDANKRTLQTAVGMYFADHGEYPTNESKPEDWRAPDEAGGDAYIDNAASFKCPKDNGTYSWDDTNEVVKCSVHDNTTTSTP